MVGNSFIFIGEGKGGVVGFVKGVVKVSFVDIDDGGIWLFYDVEVKVGGKLV